MPNAIPACIKRMASPALLEHLAARGSVARHRGFEQLRRLLTVLWLVASGA
jgi:hypothetical protein